MADETVDFHPDSGSGTYNEAMKDAQTPDTERAEGDVGATTFDPTDAAPSKRKRFNELRKRHHEHWDKNGYQHLTSEMAYDTRLVCNRLELTDVQERRVIKLVEQYRKDGRKYELTILGVVTYVLNEDGRWIQRAESSEDDTDSVGDPLHDEWRSICDAFDVTRSEIDAVVAEISSSSRRGAISDLNDRGSSRSARVGTRRNDSE